MNVICAARGWNGIMLDYARRYDGIYELLNLVTLVFGLRMCPRSDECPTMDTAVELWHRFNVTIMDPEVQLAWMEKHATLVWFALREYQLYLVQQVPPLYYVLTRFLNLNAISASVCSGMDRTAWIYNKHSFYNGPDPKADGKLVDTEKMLYKEYYNYEQLPHVRSSLVVFL